MAKKVTPAFIDPPGPFDPVEAWREHLRAMEALERKGTPGIRRFVAEAKRRISELDSEAAA